jgi:hypothetical protein
MFRINEILKYNGVSYRILALLSTQVVWIRIDDDNSLPSLIDLEELRSTIDKGKLTREKEVFGELLFQMPEDGSTAKFKRDKNYQLIKPLIDSPKFFLPKVRSEIISQIIEEHGSTKQTLYRLVRRYWQRGQIPNALLPDYKNSGARGEKRVAQNQKLGRPRKYKPGVGVNIDEFIERLFRIVIDKYLLTNKGFSFPYAHRRFKDKYETYFPNTPEEEMPTIWQLKHFYEREYKLVEKLKSRSSKIEFNKDIRPLKSTANTQVLGPGSRFEIDATIADIYLVSDSDRANIVGRPVIYIVKDVFSRMVAGFYVGFENPSYVAAMQALVVAMTDKVAYCKIYGFEIDEKDWPVVGLPDAILADRGELLGHQIEGLENNFSVRIENAPPYRGDAKSIVERSFKTIQADFTPFAPGVVKGTKIKKRGDKDYRLDAKLSVQDFKGIILSSILYHNQYATLKKYDRDIDIPADLPLVPLHLWNWGIQHRTGRLRSASEDALRVSLMPRVKASISELGISAFGIYFTSPEVIQEGWLHRSSSVSRPVNLEVGYDPASADNIYLFPKKNSAEYWTCKLAERSREFSNCSFWDVWQVQDQQKQVMAQADQLSEKKKREHERLIKSKIKSASSKSPNTNGFTNAEHIAAINNNKRKEKKLERQDSAYRPPDVVNKKPAQVIHLGEPKTEDFSYPDHIDELFDEDE